MCFIIGKKPFEYLKKNEIKISLLDDKHVL